jgi:hypothetical protein
MTLAFCIIGMLSISLVLFCFYLFAAIGWVREELRIHKIYVRDYLRTVEKEIPTTRQFYDDVLKIIKSGVSHE